MSNRAEYACSAVLLVTAISAFFAFFDWGKENGPEQNRPPTAITTDTIGLSAINSREDPRLHDSRSALEKEDGHGLNELGMMYLNGTGARRDLSAAFLLLSWAAQAGDVSAMNNLGRMYEEGLGTDSDIKRASELYAKAAQLSNQLARDNLQRLRATYPEADATLLPSASRSIMTSSFTRASVEGSTPGKPKPIRITARYTWAARSDLAEKTVSESSSDTGWSTGAIPLTGPVAAQNPGSPQRLKLRRSTAPGKPPVTRSVPRMLLQEPEIGKPSQNGPGKSNTELGLVDRVDGLSSQPCSIGNWTGTPRC